MKFKVKCPYCEKMNTQEVDTASADRGTVYKDLIECESCDKPFILNTEILVKLTILPVASEPVEESTYRKQRRVKDLLEKLERELI